MINKQKIKYFQAMLSLNQPFTDFEFKLQAVKPGPMTDFNRETVCQ